MAIKGVKAPRKTKKIRSTKAGDEKYLGTEPTWKDINSIEDENFNGRVVDALNYYNYFNKVKDLKQEVVTYLNANSKFSAADVKDFGKSSDALIPITVCSISAAANRGMPMSEEWHDYIINKVANALARYSKDHEPEDVSKPKKKVKTIQDRLREALDVQLAHLEEMEDRVLYDGAKTDPKVFEYFSIEKVPQSQLSKVIDLFKVREAEFIELGTKDCDPELKAAYKHYKVADRKRILAFYTKLFEGVELYKESKKATRKIRKKKPVSKTKLIAKLKYKQNDAAYKVISIDPIEIIGAKEVWVFNTKTRKLGKYVADEMGELSIKGTTIIGFDPMKSVSKTLRKPAQQLAEFKKAGKVKLRTFLKDIKAVEVKINGRLNADTVILRAAT